MQVVDPQRYEKPRSSTTYLYVDFQYVKDLFSSFCAPKKQKTHPSTIGSQVIIRATQLFTNNLFVKKFFCSARENNQRIVFQFHYFFCRQNPFKRFIFFHSQEMFAQFIAFQFNQMPIAYCLKCHLFQGGLPTSLQISYLNLNRQNKNTFF